MKSNAGFLNSQNTHLGNRIFEKMLKDSGIDAFSGAQGRIMYVLWENGTLSVSQVCKLTSLANSTMTVMLDQMEVRGLINRTRNERNRKQILVSLTDTARLYKKEYDYISEKMNNLTYKGFSQEELMMYENMLIRIKKNLEDYIENGENND
ncbi:MAG: MarR family transcriptional regulator [Clostridia bacterium]|nr:MarR family transcriptional regulator [Clostridia bacterium]